MTLAEPPDVASELVDRIESPPLDQALRQAERHRGIVSPLARLKRERTAAEHVGNRGERSRSAELERRAECIASREAQQSAAIARTSVDRHAVRCIIARRSRTFFGHMSINSKTRPSSASAVRKASGQRVFKLRVRREIVQRIPANLWDQRDRRDL